MLRIRGVLWDEESELHVWSRHGIAAWEVEEAAYAARLVVRGRGRGVYEVYGQTEAGRYLLIVIRVVEKDLAKVITARDMTQAERRRYKQRIFH